MGVCLNNLIVWEKFTSSAGKELDFKIECDALTDEDLESLAKIVATRVPYGKAIGVPRGGLRFAEKLNKYANKDAPYVLIVDDVLTTGKSMEKMKTELNTKYSFGIVIFARGECPDWIIPMFTLHNMWKTDEYMHNQEI